MSLHRGLENKQKTYNIVCSTNLTKKNQNFANFVVIFVKITFFIKQKRHSIEDSKTNKKNVTLFVPQI